MSVEDLYNPIIRRLNDERSVGSNDPARYAIELSMAADLYRRHIGDLALHAIRPEPEQMQNTEGFERSMRDGIHRGARLLSDLATSPNFEVVLARVDRRPKDFRIRLQSSRWDALELVTIIAAPHRRGRYVELIADRVAEAGVWFQDLALALDVTATHRTHAPAVQPTPAKPSATKPKRRGRTAGVNKIDQALAVLIARLKDNEDCRIASIAKEVGCTPKNLKKSKRFKRRYDELVKANIREIRHRGAKVEGTVEAWDNQYRGAWVDPRGDQDDEDRDF